MTASANRPRWSRLLLLLLPVLASFLVYERNLDDYFVADDFDLIQSFYGQPPSYFLKLLVWNESNQIWKTLGLDPEIGTGFLRPFKIWVLKLDLMLWGVNPVGYHLTSALFFALNVVMIFLILELLLPGRLHLAALGGWLVAIHPVFSEIVPFITAREETMATGLSLLAVYVFLRLRLRLRAGRAYLFYVAYGLALLTKESAIVAIGIPAGYDLVQALLDPEARRDWKRRLRFYYPLPVMLAVYFLLRFIAFGNLTGGDTEGTRYLSIEAFLEFHALFYRFFYHPLMLSVHRVPYVAWIGGACLAGLLATAWLRRERLGRGFLALLLFAGPIWYFSATAIAYGSYFSPRHNAFAILGVILFVVLLLDGCTRGLGRPAMWVSAAAALLAAGLFLPPTLAMSATYDEASRTVAQVRETIEKETADLPPGSAILVENVPQWTRPPWYFGYGLLSALKKPFTESDLARESIVINRWNIRINEYPIDPPKRFDRRLDFGLQEKEPELRGRWK